MAPLLCAISLPRLGSGTPEKSISDAPEVRQGSRRGGFSTPKLVKLAENKAFADFVKKMVDYGENLI
jgi:hypothetical protein